MTKKEPNKPDDIQTKLCSSVRISTDYILQTTTYRKMADIKTYKFYTMIAVRLEVT